MGVLPRFLLQEDPRTVAVRALTARALGGRDQEAARQLGRLGVAGIQALVDKFPRRRHRAAVMLHEALGEMERAGTAAALQNLRIHEVAFARLLVDPRPLVRSVAVRVVGQTGNRIWIPLLITRLRDDRDPFVRTRAADALGSLGAIEASSLLFGLIDDRTEPARYHAVSALGRLGEAAWGHLAWLATGHPDETVRRVAVQTVARTSDQAAWLGFLRALERVPSADIRKTAVEGLGRSGVTRAAHPLVRALLTDPSPAVREAAADGLAALGEPETVPALAESALHDPYWVPPGPRRAEPSNEAGEVGDRDYPVRDAASEALLVVGGMRAWEELRHPRGRAHGSRLAAGLLQASSASKG